VGPAGRPALERRPELPGGRAVLAAADRFEGLWLVGGAVRDALLALVCSRALVWLAGVVAFAVAGARDPRVPHIGTVGDAALLDLTSRFDRWQPNGAADLNGIDASPKIKAITPSAASAACFILNLS